MESDHESAMKSDDHRGKESERLYQKRRFFSKSKREKLKFTEAILREDLKDPAMLIFDLYRFVDDVKTLEALKELPHIIFDETKYEKRWIIVGYPGPEQAELRLSLQKFAPLRAMFATSQSHIDVGDLCEFIMHDKISGRGGYHWVYMGCLDLDSTPSDVNQMSLMISVDDFNAWIEFEECVGMERRHAAFRQILTV